MAGRGIYKFGVGSAAAFYIGELKENQLHGLGRIAFRDGTQYFGSFNFNVMQSQQALVKFSNGDKYSGIVVQNMKSDEAGSYIFAERGDRYEGCFKGDKIEGVGKFVIAGPPGHPDVLFEG